MGKNLIIKQYQNARLEEWIGDIKNANLIYEEILKSDNKLSYLLKETIRSRKDSYEKLTQLDFNDMEAIYINQVKVDKEGSGQVGSGRSGPGQEEPGRAETRQMNLSETKPSELDRSGPGQTESCQSEIDQTGSNQTKFSQLVPNQPETNQLYQEEALKPHKNIGERLELTNLRYSVSVTAKVDKHLKLEIRGYHPEENKPDINVELGIHGWRIKDMDKSKSKKKSLRELYLTSKEDNLKVYLTIDQWGLLNGSVIIDEKNLGDSLVGLHRMLYELCKKM